MFTGLLALLGIGGFGLWWMGLLPVIISALTPIVKVVVGWVMSFLDWFVRRYVKEVQGLFDVFPFFILLTFFIAGGLYFRGPEAVVERTKVVVQKTTKYVNRTVYKRVTPRSSVRASREVQDLFTHPLGRN